MEATHVRDFSEFCEQLNEIRLKFHKWDSCEKTVGLYYLMVGLPFANAKFLQHALEQSIASVETPDAQILERDANNTVFVSNILSQSPKMALNSILNHLPLLRPGNTGAIKCYLNIIRQVLTEFITPPQKIYNECVEIMSYVYIHPAFSNEDKKSFKHILKQVLNKVTPQNFVHSPMNDSSDESVSPNPECQNVKKRSNSLTPSQDSCQEMFIPGKEGWYSQESLAPPQGKPRSYSLSSEKSLLSHIPIQSSSSETRLQDLRLINNLPAMKSIVSWLKSLRLHKYSWVFNNLSYKEMIELKEDNLIAIGITKGARHKLLLNINKLKERSSMLTELETEVMNGGDLNIALKKLKNVLQSPLQLSAGEDLPSQFVKVMGKVCTQLLMLRQPSDDFLMLFSSLCEKAETLDAFTEDQKKRLNMWKDQLLNEDYPAAYIQKQQKSCNSSRMQNVPFNVPKMSITHSYTQKSSSYPNMKNNNTLNTHRHSVDSVTLQNQLFATSQAQQVTKNSTNNFNGSSQLSIEDKPMSFGTLCSYFNKVKQNEKETRHSNLDIESSLESLCLQMMEHALGP